MSLQAYSREAGGGSAAYFRRPTKQSSSCISIESFMQLVERIAVVIGRLLRPGSCFARVAFAGVRPRLRSLPPEVHEGAVAPASRR